MLLNVNTYKVNKLTKQLGTLHRSAFPSAVRNTLNDAAFDMKKTEIINSANSTFKVKAPTFFKRYTGVNKAQGFKVDNMIASVGFLNASDPNVRKAIEGMSKQEFGGIVDDGINYLRASRGGNLGKLVQRKNYYDKSKIQSGQSARPGTRKSKFVARAYKTKRDKKMMFMNSMKGNFLVTVSAFKRGRNGRLNIKFNFVAMSRETKPTKIKKTQFLTKAGKKTSSKLNDFYHRNAEFQIKKHLKV